MHIRYVRLTQDRSSLPLSWVEKPYKTMRIPVDEAGHFRKNLPKMTRFTVGIWCVTHPLQQLPALSLSTHYMNSGAGIAGVCLALELMGSPDIRVDLYESSTELSAAGASITISRKAQYVLRKMGLEDACVRACQDAGEGRGMLL